MEPVRVKYVANYLRKSRGDQDSDLDKHRTVLTELCEKNKWESVEYHEIETGDSIELRPQMRRLLDDVASGLYDAVCVVDIDRLGRGDMGDQDRIKKVFARSKTLIITPEHTYNLDNENDEFSIDIKSFIAHQEYKLIVKRLVQGKKVGARRGAWTNGTPPFPYEYQRGGEKGLIVNEDKLRIYRSIIDAIIHENKTPQEIAVELNQMGVLSPKGVAWSSQTVYRLARDQTHLGYIVSNKTKGNAHKRKKASSKDFIEVPQKDWIIAKGAHSPIKTEKEHEQILVFFSRTPGISRRKPDEILPLTGIVKCGICGRTMSLWVRENRNNEEYLKPCWYKNELGEKCKNRGKKSEIIYDQLWRSLDQYEGRLQELLQDETITQANEVLLRKLKIAEDELRNKKKVVERLLDAYENGVFTVDDLKARKQKADAAIDSAQQAITLIKIEIKQFDRAAIRERVCLIAKFKEAATIANLDAKERNRWLRTIIKEIKWTRIEGCDPQIDFYFN